MSKPVGDYLIERLNEWGVSRIYGFPGDGINGIMGAPDRADKKIDFIQVRHEENAAFMACAHAKYTGEVGVCLATSGPGAIHLLKVDKEDDIADALKRAFACRRPVLLEAYTDPSVPPLPPHITFKQAKGFASSMLKGEENTWDMIEQSRKGIVKDYIH